jgi:LPXTG-motif cell wall-anchored protein
MKHLPSVTLAAFAGCIGVVLAPAIQADDWNKKTTLTVTEAVQLPSCCTPGHTVTLQPGEYVMVLVDSLSDRHIVRVFDKNQEHVITTILAIPNYRLQPTGKTVFQYWEVPAGQPQALRAWFYPGDNFGQEFAYHKQTAAQIAAYVNTPVPAVEADTSAAEDLKTAPIVVIDQIGKVSPLVLTKPDATPAFETVPVQSAPAAAESFTQTAERTKPSPAQETTPQTLPQTASAMPLLVLVGVFALAAFAVLSIRARNANL